MAELSRLQELCCYDWRIVLVRVVMAVALLVWIARLAYSPKFRRREYATWRLIVIIAKRVIRKLLLEG